MYAFNYAFQLQTQTDLLMYRVYSESENLWSLQNRYNEFCVYIFL